MPSRLLTSPLQTTSMLHCCRWSSSDAPAMSFAGARGRPSGPAARGWRDACDRRSAGGAVQSVPRLAADVHPGPCLQLYPSVSRSASCLPSSLLIPTCPLASVVPLGFGRALGFHPAPWASAMPLASIQPSRLLPCPGLLPCLGSRPALDSRPLLGFRSTSLVLLSSPLTPALPTS